MRNGGANAQVGEKCGEQICMERKEGAAESAEHCTAPYGALHAALEAHSPASWNTAV